MRALTGRLLTLSFAVVQFALPGVLSVADGAVANAVGESVVHVEDAARKNCKPPHSEECVICRYLAAGAVVNAGHELCVATVVRVELPAAAIAAARSAPAFGLHSRAPPALLS